MSGDTSYRIRGTSATLTAPPQASSLTNPRHIDLGLGRGGPGGEVQARGDDLARVELGNGFVLWSRLDDLLKERGRLERSRGGEELWSLTGESGDQARGGSRGALGTVIKALDLFGVDLEGRVALGLGEALENRLLGQSPGLYRVDLGDTWALSALPEGTGIPKANGPTLVFLHGTASSCKSSYSDLWAPGNSAGSALRQALARRYGDRVYAWEHRSLTESPIANALGLAMLLEPGVELHLVSHSRGGLVGELLCLAELDPATDLLTPERVEQLFAADRTLAPQLGLSPLDKEAAAERDKAYQADRDRLLALRAELTRAKPRIGRFVRVACPVRGTTLASGRLDRWLSALGTVGNLPLVGDVLDFLALVVKERTDPRTLPGLEAMMPGSALTRLLSDPNLVTASDLSVISGDCEGDTLWARFKLLAADWFYASDHDLVVNTGSMYGGLRRKGDAARFQLDRGPEVNHFHYFCNDKSVRWLLKGLERADGADGGFLPLCEARQEVPPSRGALARSAAVTRPRPLAVILPGVMGSALRVDGRDTWLDYRELARGGLARIGMATAARVEPSGLLENFYGPLIEYLSTSHRVELFPYDWRKSVREAAADLTERLEAWVTDAERQGQPVRLVAHSMGGLVVRAMIGDGGRGANLWRRIAARAESRLVMLGTPNRGSWEAVRWLTGSNATLAKLALLDVTHGSDAIVGIVCRFPGLLELLPWGDQDPDLTRAQVWKDLRRELQALWETPEGDDLRQAQQTWAMLRRSPVEGRTMVYVAGCQPATVVGYHLEAYEESYLAGRRRMALIASHEGDGTVPWTSGFLPGVPVWYAPDTAHDALCSNRALFPGYLDLITSGQTARLSQNPPTRSRGASAEDRRFDLPASPPADAIPGPQDLARAGFGPGAPSPASGPVSPRIQVRVRHGNLAYARHPVLVGHYLDDTIVNAERTLDERLGGQMTRRQQLGLYPGRPGSYAFFFPDDPAAKPAGALLVGLGQVGSLSPGALQAGVRDTLLAFALHLAQWPDGRFGGTGELRSAAVSCLLVGSGDGGLGVRDSVESILRGALAAADRLAEAGLDRRVIIDRIELLEIYQDVAVAAAEALELVLADSVLALRIDWPEHVVETGEGQLRRIGCRQSGDWWQRLEILEEDGGEALRFIASTDRARAEETLATGQLSLAEAFVAKAQTSPRANAEASKTLFEMLLPTRLRELSPRQDDLVILVDETAARFPWELLEDRWSNSGRPPAIAAGMLRQLKTQEFRQHVASSAGLKALVVGNPDLGGWEGYSDLPGAREEAQQVAQTLRKVGWVVRDCIDEPSDTVINALHRDAWRVLHLAGHGEHDLPVSDASPLAPCTACARPLEPRVVRRSGMLIGRNTLLTPGDVAQMRWVPELVFINCCHLGKTVSPTPRRYAALAANLGVQFIRMGVKAVVAAGWAVDDAAGRAFAQGLYARLLAGETFGEAVRAAREEVWVRFPEVNTWGAYQCYGDPSYRLVVAEGSRTRREQRRYHAPYELVADLENLTESIRTRLRGEGDDAAVLDELGNEIEETLRGIPAGQREAWLGRADVAAAVGNAWGETRAYAKAVEWLKRALEEGEGDCPLSTVERYNNLRVRWVGERWEALRRAGASGDGDAKRLSLIQEIDETVAELAQICQLRPNVERLDVLGVACRRLAWLQTSKRERREALINMAGYLDKALDPATGDNPHLYPSWAIAKLLATRIEEADDASLSAAIEDGCRHMAEVAAARNRDDPRLRNALDEADNLLVAFVAAGGEDADAAQRVADCYRAALARGASPREVAKVQEGIDFLIAFADQLKVPVVSALRDIRASL